MDRVPIRARTRCRTSSNCSRSDRIMTGRRVLGAPGDRAGHGFLVPSVLSMGIPAPAHSGAGGARWEPTDLAEFVDRRAWISRPYGPSVRIVSETNGASTERHAVVLSMGAMPDLHWPESGAEPWMLAASRLPFPVEWSLSGVLLKSSVLSPAAVFEQQRAESIADHYAEHHVTPPPAVARAIEAAATNIDEITEGDARMSARWSGTIRLAVYGSSEDEALRRARDLVDHYGEQLRMPLGKTLDQAQVLREFIPGEPRDRARLAAPAVRPLPGRRSAECRQRTGHSERAVLRVRHRLGAASGPVRPASRPGEAEHTGPGDDHRRTRRRKERADRHAWPTTRSAAGSGRSSSTRPGRWHDCAGCPSWRRSAASWI